MDEAVRGSGLARADHLINLPLAFRRRLALDDEQADLPVRVCRFKLSQPRINAPVHARAPSRSPNFLMHTNRSRSLASYVLQGLIRHLGRIRLSEQQSQERSALAAEFLKENCAGAHGLFED